MEDGDINHYVYDGPLDWSMSIVSVARSHDIPPTEHGTVTDKAGTCAFVLRFSGPQKTQNFHVGFDYVQSDARFHDVQWKTSDNRQTNWTFPAGEGKGPVHSPLRMNVLLIVLDDVGTDKLELFDTPHATPHEYAKIPNLELLAANGVQFTNFYVNPVCSTSRACFQTGRYAHHHGLGTLASADWSLPQCEVTLGELLKLGFTDSEAAYSTGAFGKWHLTYPSNVYPYTVHAISNGYDRFFGTLGNSLDHFDWTKVESDVTWIDPVTPTITDQWTANVARADATSWIDSATEPFFAYVAFNPPHHPFDPPPYETEDSRALLSLETIEAIEDVDPDDPERFELFYRAMIEAVDAEIGYLLDDMDPAKRARTMVMVVSDNGTPEGVVSDPHPHPDRSKATIYQLGVRVPMIVAGPLAATGVCDAAVGAVDLFATIAAITGADPGVMDAAPCAVPDRNSVSFLPLIEDPSGSSSRPAFSQMFVPNGSVDDSASFDCLETHVRAVTDGTYKYIRRLLHDDPLNCQACTSPCDYEHEFYDLIADPEEGTNLYPPSAPLQAIYDSLSAYMDLFEF